MKLTSLITALALATAMASPSFAAPYSAGAHLTAKSSVVTNIAHEKHERTKKTGKPRCFAWPGGCT